MVKLESIQELFGRTIEDLDAHTWPEFLKTAAWTFKYNFPDQLLIYAQRPDATACASIDVWNKRLNRTVKADAAHIALIDDRGDEIKLHYVVDISDTEGPGQVPLWRLTAQNKEYVYTSLAAGFDVPVAGKNENATSFFERIASTMVSQAMPQASLSLQRIQSSCDGLRYLTSAAAEAFLQEILTASVTSVMMHRCNLVPDFSAAPADPFRNLSLFKDPRALSILGQTTQALSRDALLVAAKAARDWDRTHKEEFEYEHSVSESRGVSDPGTDHGSDRVSEPVRETSQDLSADAAAQRVHRDDADRTVGNAPEGNRAIGADDVRAAAERADGSEPGSEQSSERSGLDSAHAEPSASGGYAGSDGAGVRLTEENLPDAAEYGIQVSFPTTAEQAVTVASANSLLSIPQEEIDAVLTSDFSQKIDFGAIHTFFASEPDSEEAAAFLKEHYDGLDDAVILPDGRYVSVQALQSGLFLNADDARGTIAWNETASRIRTLIQNNRFPVPQAQQDPVPLSSQELEEGQVFSLAGTRYLVAGISAETVVLQDVEHPIFTNPMQRSVLDLLLQNEAKASGVVIAQPEASVASADEVESIHNEEMQVPEPSDAGIQEEAQPEVTAEGSKEAFQERSEPLSKRNYRFLTHYAPEIMNGSLDYMRFESDTYEPLYIERISKDKIAIAHTFTQMGDLMYDPEMVFQVNEDSNELLPLSFEQSDMQVYQRVYRSEDDPASKDVKLERQLSTFFRTWSQNLEHQDHAPVRGMKYRDSGDIEYSFGPNREMISNQEPETVVSSEPERIQDEKSGLYVGDVVSFNGDDFQITTIRGDIAESVSLRDGSVGIPMNVSQILAQANGGGTTRLTHFWERQDYQPKTPDQKALAALLNHFEKWRTSDGVYSSGELYRAAMERMSRLFVSDGPQENRVAIQDAATEIRRWFPTDDPLSSRAAETEAVLSDAAERVRIAAGITSSFEEQGNIWRLSHWRTGDEQRLLNDLSNLLHGPMCVYPAPVPEFPQGYYFMATVNTAQIVAMAQYLTHHKPDVSLLTKEQQALYRSTMESAAFYMNDIPALYPAPLGRLEPHCLYVNDIYERAGEPWQIYEFVNDSVDMISLETGELGERVTIQDLFRSVRQDEDAHLQHFWEREGFIYPGFELGQTFEMDGTKYRITRIEGTGSLVDDILDYVAVDDPGKHDSESAGYILAMMQGGQRAESRLPEINEKEEEAPVEQVETAPVTTMRFRPTSVSSIEPEPEIAQPDISLEVGDFYEDAHGRGVITQIFPAQYEGKHEAAFSYVDPDAAPGSRASKGYVMHMRSAIERIRSGAATLIPAATYQAAHTSEHELESVLSGIGSVNETVSADASAPGAVAVKATPDALGRINYRVPLEAENYGGPKARFRNNIAAIRLLKTLEAEDRLATSEEQQTLARYVGWGGIPQAFEPQNDQWAKEYQELKELLTDEEYAGARESTMTAFYTPPAVTEAIYTALNNFGFHRGNILDPCCGTGNFFGMLPESMQDSKLYGVELDSISGRISRQLYQQANILIEGYEKTNLPDSFYDVAIGNVPFGPYKLYDRRYDKENFLIHDYFFAKTLDKVRPGGIVAFVTSKGTMDKANESVRRYIAQRADLLGAIRLPNNTFRENAGTEAVADILFLKKRSRPRVDDAPWLGLGRAYNYDTEAWGPAINQYFVDHPEMVLGDAVQVSGPHGMEWTWVAREGEDLRTALQNAVSHISGSVDISMDELEETEDRKSIPADPDVRNFSFTVVDGDIYFREDSQMYQVQMNKTAQQRVKGMIGLRDITRKLIDAQLQDEPDNVVFDLQQQLNEAYDAFTEKFGIINSKANSNAFSDDSAYYLLCSLENLDDENNFLGKADMFYKRTIGKHIPITHTDTAKEALAISMGEKGKVDLDFISELCGLTHEDVLADLKGLIFPIPGKEGTYEISSIYLSGNVRKKLEVALEASKKDAKYAVNAEYLQDAIPEPLEPEDIAVRLGATWIPQEDVTAFIQELLNFDDNGYIRYYKDHIKAVYEPAVDSWLVTNKTWDTRPIVTSTYGTDRVSAYRLIEDALNQKNTQVFDTKEDENGNPRRVLNADATIAARDKQELIKEKFKEWIWSDPERTQRLSKLYNEKFNSIVPPQYDADMVVFHGMNPLIHLENHQKESVARILYGGNTQLAHEVGAGKTWTMVAAAMEAKHLGLCNKSMIVVPNHLVGQWAAAIYELYPAANVLASTKKDFETKNRKKFCSRIATGDYDIVVIAHSQFERIPLSAERQEATLKEQIQDITDSIERMHRNKAETFTIKQLERTKKSLNTKLEKLQNGKQRDDVVTFEELGTDRLFVDESHEYKNLFLATKMHNVAGISQTDSQKASDLFMKSRYIDELTGNMGNIHATGTPLSNTMAELYTTQRYLQYDLLQEMGLGSFDAWASTFGETVQSIELAPEGTGYRERTRFANFFNIPELVAIYKQVADVRPADVLNLPVPEAVYHTDVVPASEEQKAEVAKLAERADNIRQRKVTNKDDNMLCITNDGRKLALDQRLLNPELPDNPNSKTNACVKNILKYYREGEEDKLTQLVFCDLSTPTGKGFNVYQDLKDKLVAEGIPADEIRFIHEANTDAQKEAMFAKVRAGTVRILMGSTSKMGTGTNVQDRLIALHDLDCPWRPSDLQQRAGRGIRRGNQNEKVHVHRYVTENTFDAYLYQLIEAKQRFASQIFTSKSPVRVAADVDESVLNYSQIKALASGNPKIREKIELEIEIARLQTVENNYKREQRHLQFLMNHIPENQAKVMERLTGLEEDFRLVTSGPSRTEKGELLPAEVQGVTYESQKAAGDAVFEALKHLPEKDKWFCIGHLRGFRILARNFENQKCHLAIAGQRMYGVNYGDDAVGLMVRLNNVLDGGIEKNVRDCKKELAELDRDFRSVQSEYGKPFSGAEVLKEKRARLQELEKELNLDHMENSNNVEQTDIAAPDAPQSLSLEARIADAQRRSGAQQTSSLGRGNSEHVLS